MKPLIWSICFYFSLHAASAQTFDECAQKYHERYNKIGLDLSLYRINDATADSLISIIDRELQECIIGKQISNFRMTATSGNSYSASDLRGKVVMIDFWSLSCGPCIEEVPLLNRLQELYRTNGDFVLLSILREKDEDFEKFLDKGLLKSRIKYEVVPNGKFIIKENFKLVKSLPTHLFIDREGNVYNRVIGGMKDEKSFAVIKSIVDYGLTKP